MSVVVHPELVEGAVFIAMRAEPSTAFNRAREKVYGIEHPEERDRAFTELHERWFVKLGLRDPILDALEMYPRVQDGIERCNIVPARRSRNEDVELFVQDEDARHLRVRLTPDTLASPAATRALLIRELVFIDDMLDPEFGYEPHLPPSPAGSTYDRLLLERYAAVWAASVAGRLSARGQLGPTRVESLRRLVRVFPSYAERTDELGRLFDGPRPTHSAIVELITAPGARCPACTMPTHDFETVAGESMCPQCAEMRRAKMMQMHHGRA